MSKLEDRKKTLSKYIREECDGQTERFNVKDAIDYLRNNGCACRNLADSTLRRIIKQIRHIWIERSVERIEKLMKSRNLDFNDSITFDMFMHWLNVEYGFDGWLVIARPNRFEGYGAQPNTFEELVNILHDEFLLYVSIAERRGYTMDTYGAKHPLSSVPKIVEFFGNYLLRNSEDGRRSLALQISGSQPMQEALADLAEEDKIRIGYKNVSEGEE